MIEKGILEKLSKRGVMFTVHLVDGNFDLTPGEVLEYLEDPDMFGAKMHGVSLQKYRGWKNLAEKYFKGDYYCSAITKKGKRCKGVVNSIDLKDYMLGVSEYCSIHQRYGIK